MEPKHDQRSGPDETRDGLKPYLPVILSEAKNPATSINFELNLSGQIYSLLAAKPAPIMN